MLVAWHPTKSWDCCWPEDEKKESFRRELERTNFY